MGVFTPGHTIQVLHTSEEFDAMLPQWQRLWSQDPHARPFQRPEWLLPWWHHFGQATLYVVTIHNDEELIGLLPLYVYVEPTRNERQLLVVGAGTSDYLDGIFAPGCAVADVLHALALLADLPDWDVAYFTQLLPGSPLYAALDGTSAARFAGESCSVCPALPIAGLPRKVRADVRYFYNAAIGRGKVRLQVADAVSAPAAFDDLVRLHSMRWQESQQAGVLADPAVLAWHREAIPRLQAAGCLRLYTLMLDDEPTAALYALIDPPGRARRTAYLYLIGYSPAHAAFMPGTLLTAMASEHAATEGVEVLDMLRGEESYKKFWRVQQVPTFGFALRREDLPSR